MKKGLFIFMALMVSMLTWGQTVLISPTGDGGFETGSTFAANNWAAVNASPDGWVIGSVPVVSDGTNCGFVSSNGGTSWTYSQTNQFVHLYYDVTIPAGESIINLSFKWKANGEGSTSDWDNLKVFFAPNTVTPIQGSGVSAAYQVGATYYSLSYTSWNSVSNITINGTPGTTYRLIFSWKSDVSTIGNPPAAIDEVSLTSRAPNSLHGLYTINNTLPTTATLLHDGTDNFNSFTAAINHLNSDGISASVTFNVTAAQTFEENTPAITATGTDVNTITFLKSGAGANPVITPTGTTGSTDAGITITGGDYFTFDGIDIDASAITAVEYGYYIRNASATDGAQYNTIKNNTITLNRSNTSSRGIYQNVVTTPSNITGANSYNKYQFIAVENSYQGIYLAGNTTYPDLSSEISNCIIGASTANDIGNGSSTTNGIRISNGSDVSVFNNEIQNMTVTGSVALYGMYFESLKGTSNNIYNNKIHDLKSTSTSTSSLIYALRTDINTSMACNVYNNMIYGLQHGITTASATNVIRGISVGMSGAGTGNFYYNSVRIDEDAFPSSQCFYINGGTANLKNNIFANFSTAGATSKRYCIYRGTSGTLNNVDYNNYYITTGTNNFVGYHTTDRASLTDWQNASTKDANSKDVNPMFFGATNLHSTSSDLNAAGVTISIANGDALDITTDIDGDLRNSTTPDMGADEFDPPTCVMPTALVYSAVTNNSATITWTASSSSPTDGYHIYYSTSATEPIEATVASASVLAGVTTYGMTSLTANITHYVWVRSNCGAGDLSAWTGPVVFTTECNSTTVPYNQDFESASVPALPNCTSVQNAGTGNNWETANNPGYGFTSKTLRYSYNAANAANTWFYTQGIDLVAGTSYRLTFKYGNNGGATFTERMKVSYGTSADVSSMVNSLADYSNITNSTPNSVTIDFIPTGTETYYFGFNCYSIADRNALFVDDILLDLTPTCIVPTALTSSAITVNSATISWTASVSTPANGYEYFVSTTATPVPDAATTATGTTAAGVTTANLSSLTANTTYYFWVRSNCDGTDKSAWEGASTFTTPCTSITTFPWTENFESITTPNLPNCWIQIDNNADGDFWKTWTGYGVGGSNAAGLYTDYNSGNNDDYLILPGFELTGNQRLKYSVRARSSGEPNDYKVVLSTTGTAPADFTTELLPLTVVSNTIMTEITPINLSAYTGNVYIAIHVPAGGLDGYYIYFDNFTVEDIPTCIVPTALTYSAVTSSSATISWTASVSTPANGYEYFVSTTATPVPDAATTATGTTAAGVTTANLSSLTANTTYYFWVRSNCDGTDKSAWAGAGNFYTGYCIPAPTSVDGSGITNVTFGQTLIVNNTTIAETNNYGNYSAMIGDGAKTTDLTVSIRYATGYGYGTKIWVDWNNDLDFVDVGELVYTGLSTSSNPTTLVATFNIPGVIPNGNYRMRIGGTDDDAGPSTPCYTGSYATFEDYTLQVTDAPSCPVPSVLSASDVTATSAVLNWTENGSAVNWNIKASLTPINPETDPALYELSTSNNPFTTPAVLTPNTTYYWYVQADCGGETSAWSVQSTFKTLCGVYTTPFNEDFSTYLPGCWAEFTGTLAAPTVTIGTTSAWFADGFANVGTTGAAGMNNYGTTRKEWLVSPSIDLGDGSTPYQLSFDLALTAYSSTSPAATSGTDDKFAVVISTDNGATWSSANTLRLWDNAGSPYVYNNIATAGENIVINLSAYTGTVKIGFYGESTVTNADNDLFVDNFIVMEVPSCIVPTALTSSAITTTSATISWTASASAPANGYEYFVATTATPVPDGATVATGSVAAGVTTVNLSSLTASTTYYVWVRANCGVGDYSMWTSQHMFTTSCDVLSAFNQSFDGVTAPALPLCWSKYTSPSYTYETVITYATAPNTAPNCVRLYNSGATLPADAPMLITPQILNLNSGTKQLRFFAKGEGLNTSVVIGTMSDPLNSATFTTLQTVTGLSTTAWNEYIVSFAAYAGTDSYIAFRHPLTATYGYINIDNAILEPIPSCPTPTALFASNITTTTATLNWTETGTATSWNIVASTSPFDPTLSTGDFGVIPVGIADLPYTTPAVLSPSTPYYWYVQADCGGDLSAWSAEGEFNTQCGIIALPWTETFEDDSYTRVCWSQIQENGSIDWTFATGSTDYISTAHNGTLNASFVYNSSNDAITKLISPVIDLSATANYTLDFWHGQPEWYGDVNELKVYYRIDAASPWVQLAHYTEEVNSWTNRVIVLPNTSGTYQVAFEGINNYARAIVIDDVTIIAEFLEINLIDIYSQAQNIAVCEGTNEVDAIADLASTITITDTNDDEYIVNLTWTIASYDANTPAVYNATGTFTLPAGVVQSDPVTVLAVNATVTVNALTTPTFSFATSYCVGTTADALPTNSIEGITGTWDIATISTAAAGTVNYTFTPNANQCAATAIIAVTVIDLPVVTCPADFTVTTTAVVTLTGGLPAGGVYSGTGVTAGDFDPSALANTDYTLTYTYDNGTCENFCDFVATVNISYPELNVIDLYSDVADINVCAGTTEAAAIADLATGITITNTDDTEFIVPITWIIASYDAGVPTDYTATGTFTLPIGVSQTTPIATLLEVTATVTVDAATVPTFSFDTEYCVGATADALPLTSGNGVTGTWNITTISTATASTTDYIFTPTTGVCAVPVTISVTVNPIVTPTFSFDTEYCVGATADALPLTSGNGVTGTWNIATISTATASTTDYIFTPTSGVCADPVTISVTVNPNVTPTFSFDTEYCVGATADALPLTSGNGITGTWNITTISTATASTTDYIFTPTTGVCAVPVTISVTVNPIVTPTFDFATSYCVGATADALPATSIEGIIGTWNIATISTATAGSTDYTFTTDAGQCADASVVIAVTVNDIVTPTFSFDTEYCVGATADALPLTSGNGITGTWNITTISTVSAGSTDYIFTPTSGVCANPVTISVTVNALPVVTCPADFTVIVEDVVTLSGAMPVGGTYSGTGVTGDNFDPSALTNGSYTITYTYADATTTCSNFCEFIITVNIPFPAIAEIDITNAVADLAVCLGAVEADALALLASQITIEDADANQYVVNLTWAITSFNGNTAAVYNATGTFELPATVSQTDPATPLEVTATVTVNALPVVECPETMAIESNAGVTTLTGATPTGGVYSGTNVTAGAFDPTGLTIGSYTITYTYTDATTGCENSCDFNIDVVTGIITNESAKIGIYPNPNNGMFTLSINNVNGKVNYQIYDTKGSIIIEENIQSNGNTIKEVSLNLVPGIYYIRIITETQTFVEKLVIE